MKNKGWLIYSKKDADRNKSYINWFITECRLKNIELKLQLREDISIGIQQNQLSVHINGNIPDSLPDFVIVRVIDPLLNLQFEKMNILVFNNSEVARIANDKALAHLHASTIGLPMVNTLFLKKGNMQKEPPIHFPFVVKQADGRSGDQVKKIENTLQWKEARETFFNVDTILQETSVLPGKDLRVFVIGKQIIAAILRENTSDFRANISRGGAARMYQLSTAEKRLVSMLLDAFDFGLAGIDFLFDRDGRLLFNEIEDAVGSRSLSKLSSINLLEQYVSFINQRLNDRENYIK